MGKPDASVRHDLNAFFLKIALALRQTWDLLVFICLLSLKRSALDPRLLRTSKDKIMS